MLIAIGIMIAMYPLGDRFYSWYWQRQIMENYQELNATLSKEIDDVQIEAYGYEDMLDIQQSEVNDSVSIENQDVDLERDENVVNNTNKTTSSEKELPTPIGILTIDKIHLMQPIFEGTNQKNLKIGLGHMEKTSKLGELGNAAIAGHRSHTYGRFFNRLDELEVNDEIVLQVAGENLRYVVTQKLVVDPTDISVLRINKKERTLTLITCHPLYTSTHRLIIRAKTF